MEYTIEVRRTIRESLTITLCADNREDALTNARLRAICASDSPDWDCYDCDYWIDD